MVFTFGAPAALVVLLVAASIAIADGFVVSTLAGTGEFGFLDGPVANAKFWSPRGVTVGVTGNVYVANQLNQLIRKVDPSGAVTNPGWLWRPGILQRRRRRC